jgi:hypothetical protein
MLTMTDTLRDRIKEEVLDGILSMFSENDPVEMAAGYITDAVIAVVSDEYINSRGMFHEPDRCLGCEECNDLNNCNPHPDAPHGFDRNASHNEGRSVCDCEHWSPPDDDDPYEAKADAERQQWADDEGIPR